MAQNLSKIWASGGFDGKQKLQALAFPEGVTFDKKTGAVRTERVNTLFEQIPQLAGTTAENENDHPEGDGHLSSKVPRTGIEPAHP